MIKSDPRTRQLLLAVVCCVVSTQSVLAERDPIRLTHGPMLGKPTSRSMTVWARTSDPGEFSVRFGTDANQLDRVSQVGENGTWTRQYWRRRVEESQGGHTLPLPCNYWQSSSWFARQFPYASQF